MLITKFWRLDKVSWPDCAWISMYLTCDEVEAVLTSDEVVVRLRYA